MEYGDGPFATYSSSSIGVVDNLLPDLLESRRVSDLDSLSLQEGDRLLKRPVLVGGCMQGETRYREGEEQWTLVGEEGKKGDEISMILPQSLTNIMSLTLVFAK